MKRSRAELEKGRQTKHARLTVINRAFEQGQYQTAHDAAIDCWQRPYLFTATEKLLLAIAIQIKAASRKEHALAHELWSEAIDRLQHTRKKPIIASHGIRLAEAYMGLKDIDRAWAAFRAVRDFVPGDPAETLHYYMALERLERLCDGKMTLDSLYLP